MTSICLCREIKERGVWQTFDKVLEAHGFCVYDTAPSFLGLGKGTPIPRGLSGCLRVDLFFYGGKTHSRGRSKVGRCFHGAVECRNCARKATQGRPHTSERRETENSKSATWKNFDSELHSS